MDAYQKVNSRGLFLSENVQDDSAHKPRARTSSQWAQGQKYAVACLTPSCILRAWQWRSGIQHSVLPLFILGARTRTRLLVDAYTCKGPGTTARPSWFLSSSRRGEWCSQRDAGVWKVKRGFVFETKCVTKSQRQWKESLPEVVRKKLWQRGKMRPLL